MNRNEALVFLLAAVFSGVAVYAEGKLAPADTTFVRKVAEGGMAEVKLGQLAKEKASSKAVKEFGERMVKDHSKAGNELKEVATKKGHYFAGFAKRDGQGSLRSSFEVVRFGFRQGLYAGHGQGP